MIYDAVIIGSGVAGLSAGLYLARAKKSVMIIEDGVIGGTTATLECIENYPGIISTSGINLVQTMIQQVTNLGVNIDFMNIKHIDFDKKILTCDENIVEFKTLIIASGTSYNKLNLDEESKFRFRGLSYCAVCDGSLYKNKKIVIASNGYSAKNDIDYLKNITNKIVVIDSESKIKGEGLTVYNNSHINKLNGDGQIESVDITLLNGENIRIECDAVFVALGKSTNLNLYDGIQIKDGFILSDENMHTNIEGVFCAGDIRYKTLRQIVTACSDGAIAGTEAIKYLQNK